MAEQPDAEAVKSKRDAVLWMWKAHNQVNTSKELNAVKRHGIFCLHVSPHSAMSSPTRSTRLLSSYRALCALKRLLDCDQSAFHVNVFHTCVADSRHVISCLIHITDTGTSSSKAAGMRNKAGYMHCSTYTGELRLAAHAPSPGWHACLLLPLSLSVHVIVYQCIWLAPERLVVLCPS